MNNHDEDEYYCLNNNYFSNHIALYYKRKVLKEWEEATTVCLIHNETYTPHNNHYFCQSCMEDYFMSND